MKGYDKFPAHWNVRRLKQVVNIIMGQSPEGQYLNQSEGVEFHQGKIFFGDQIIRQSDTKTLSVTKIAPAYSVLLCVRAPVGKVNITDREICIGRGLAAIECRDDISFKFLYYMLQHYEDTFKQEATGSTFEAVTVATIKNLYIPVPPKDEQDQIARFLDWKITAIDKLIAIRREELRNLAELKKALITREVTRGNWERVKIKRLFKIFSGATPDSYEPDFWDGNIIWITPADFQTKDKYIYHGAKYITESGFRSCSTSLVPSGSIIFTKRAPVGKVAISRAELCTNQGCLSCVPLEGVVPEYFYYVMSINAQEFESLSAGATFKEISLSKFRNVSLPCPPITEQQRIANYLDRICAQIDSAITNFTQQIDTLKELTARLISDTVTGKIDVRNIAVPEKEKIS